MSIEVTLRKLNKPDEHSEKQRRKVAVLPDEKIWELLREGNEVAYEVIYRSNAQRLLHYGLKIVYDEALVSDVIQDLFVELWNSKSKLSRVDHIKPYLFKAVRYKLLRQASGAQKMLRIIDEELTMASHHVLKAEETSFEDTEHRTAIHRKLRKAITLLPRKQQELLHLRFYDGLTTREITEITGISKRTVNHSLSQALKQLHEIGGDLFFFVLFSRHSYRILWN